MKTISNEKLIKALFECRNVWTHSDENKSIHCYPRPMVAMLNAVEEELNRLREKCGEPIEEKY